MPELIIRPETRRAKYFPENLGEETLEMMLIPGGAFVMGSSDSEPNRESWEGPQHEVMVSPFFMGAHQVTQSQWRFVAGLPQVNVKLESDPSHFKGSNRPVEQISWYEAVEFCDRLKENTKRPYRLPSEAEWEYACRAGTITPFYFGETITPELANYNGKIAYGDGPKGKNRGETTPVGQFPANAYGLHDMHGNVWEWCADYWHGSYEGAPTDGSAWLSDNDNTQRVIRGGSWFYQSSGSAARRTATSTRSRCPQPTMSVSVLSVPPRGHNSIHFLTLSLFRALNHNTTF